MVALSSTGRTPNCPTKRPSFWWRWLSRLHGTPPTPARTDSIPQRLKAAGKSVTGNHREQNEDRFAIDPQHGILLVADGMGGHFGGALAAEIIARTVPSYLRTSFRDTAADPAAIPAAFPRAIQFARARMARFAQRNEQYNRMGATIALAVVINRILYFCHVGDCRIYHLSKGKLERLTDDQTVVQAMVDAGAIPKQEAKTHPWRNMVLNSVGVRAMEREPEVTTLELAPGDRILLATDGLTRTVSTKMLEQLISRGQPEDAVEALVAEALDNDSKDNVSCVVAELAEP